VVQTVAIDRYSLFFCCLSIVLCFFHMFHCCLFNRYRVILFYVLCSYLIEFCLHFFDLFNKFDLILSFRIFYVKVNNKSVKRSTFASESAVFCNGSSSQCLVEFIAPSSEYPRHFAASMTIFMLILISSFIYR
jgi:hypothetical protein